MLREHLWFLEQRLGTTTLYPFGIWKRTTSLDIYAITYSTIKTWSGKIFTLIKLSDAGAGWLRGKTLAL